MSDQLAVNTIRTTADQALLAAWRRFLDYDAASANQKVHHTRIRTSIIILGFAASALAVAITYRASNPVIESIGEYLHAALIVLPIISAGLLTYASMFAPSLSWLAYRIGAELVRREVYLYRMQAGDYADKTPLEQQQMLLTQIELANKRVNKLGAPDPYLQTTIANIPKVVAGKTDSKADDGFTPLSADEYISHRVVPQKDWYISKSRTDYERARRWRIYVLIIAGLSSLVAAFRFEPFVAVTTALGAALVTFMDLRMVGRNFAIYHPTANSLEIELDRWNILNSQQQADPAQLAGLVKRVEDIFQSERDQWTQQAIQAQQAIEQSLAKSVGGTQQGQSQQQSTTTTNLVVSQPDAATTVVEMQTQVTQGAGDSGTGESAADTTTSPPVMVTVNSAPASSTEAEGSPTDAASVPADAVPVPVGANGSASSLNGNSDGSSNGVRHPADHGDGSAG
jgi:hypothetical protein